jgi:hypothetical protein
MDRFVSNAAVIFLEPIRFRWNQKRALSFCFIVRLYRKTASHFSGRTLAGASRQNRPQARPAAPSRPIPADVSFDLFPSLRAKRSNPSVNAALDSGSPRPPGRPRDDGRDASRLQSPRLSLTPLIAENLRLTISQAASAIFVQNRRQSPAAGNGAGRLNGSRIAGLPGSLTKRIAWRNA